ncbi:E3 ubiquitin-protein ligase RNF138, partial [Myotis davidii]
FCRKCFLTAMRESGIHCPLCRGNVTRRERACPERALDLENIMRKLSGSCRCCAKQIKFYRMRHHYKSCKKYQDEYGVSAIIPNFQISQDSVGNSNRSETSTSDNIETYQENTRATSVTGVPEPTVAPVDADPMVTEHVSILFHTQRFPDAAALTATVGPENPALTPQPTPENFVKDVDGGIDQDIFDINEALGLDLFEGDIRLDGVQDRNSIIGENYRWPQTIPYVLEDSLEMNAKGVILNAFERYRLKTCIDFKPWTGETNYISVFKGSGYEKSGL